MRPRSRSTWDSIAGRRQAGSGGRTTTAGTILKTSFQGGSTAARLKTACDNQVTIFLNGKQVATSDEWQEPVEADVQRHVRPGRNELIAEVANQGGPAGFIFKLALKAARRPSPLRRFRRLVDRRRAARFEGRGRTRA